MHYHVVGGGWLDTTPAGKSYLRVRFGFEIKTNTTYTMMENEKKNKPTSPDYLFYELAEDKRPGDSEEPKKIDFLRGEK